ncbi:GNAT family N-acetyltransferase [Couchioplanes caeruleus]|uniref:GNAT family N-acetyltransferase n=1 Tax=Couchioplanes caeruleus TaxID=56438 RepID=UPI0020BFA6E0|nr:GNAT family protein [Couchioplanes caeruleus]UQU66641.1 GNAT family N-acetyltransferase [Couchioplanes caeruleus]
MIELPRIRIVQLSVTALEALSRQDLAAAQAAAPVPLSAWLAGPDNSGLWLRRHRQVVADQEEAAWVTGVVWDEEAGRAVGRAGYHGRPEEGLVEIGYAVDPAYRRRGYGGAALAALLERAAREPEVRTVRLSIRPDNVPSLALAARHGFRQVGDQWDDEDGLELVFERPALARGTLGIGH